MRLSICLYLSWGAVLSSAITPEVQQTGGRDPSTLIQAYNAAFAKLVREGRFADLVAVNKVAHTAPSLCNPYGTYDWPSINSLTQTDTLFDVLNTNILKVGSVAQADWGPDGNYLLEPPVGFWPNLLSEIVIKLNENYNSNVEIQRTYTADNITSLLQSDTVHMSDIYMLMSALDDNGYPRAHASQIGCPSAYSAQYAVVLASRNINTFPEIVNVLSEASNSNKIIGVMSSENRDIIKGSIPSNIQNYQVFESDDALIEAINDQSVFMGIATGHFDNLGTTLVEIDTDVPVTFGPFFKKTLPCSSASMRKISALVPEVLFFAAGSLLLSL